MTVSESYLCVCSSVHMHWGGGHSGSVPGSHTTLPYFSPVVHPDTILVPSKLLVRRPITYLALTCST